MPSEKAPWWAEALRDFFLGMRTEDALRAAIAPGAEVVGMVTKEIEIGSGYSVAEDEARKRAQIVAFMRSQIGKTYKLGAEVKPYTDSEVWDCSEITEQAYGRVGLSLPDGSPYQFEACQPVRSPLAGDLGFLWSDAWKRIGHVLVYTGEGTVVHAVGGRGVVEDPRGVWEVHTRWRGWRRHVDFARGPEDRA